LSQADFDRIVAEITAAEAALQRSSLEIAKQERDLKTRSVLCVALGAVAVGELVVIALKK
jgi:hypothetical protein